MKLLAATILAAGMSCAVASTRHRCGTGDIPAEMMFDVANLENSQQWAQKEDQEPYIIATYVHVVTSEAKEDIYDEAMVYTQASDYPVRRPEVNAYLIYNRSKQ